MVLSFNEVLKSCGEKCHVKVNTLNCYKDCLERVISFTPGCALC